MIELKVSLISLQLPKQEQGLAWGGTAPTAGRQFDVSGSGANRRWADGTSTKTAQGIVTDIFIAVGHLVRNGSFQPNMLVLPHTVLANLLGTYTSDTNTQPLIEWIKSTLSAYGNIEVVASNAFSNTPNTQLSAGAFALLDSQKSNMAIAEVEQMTLLPSREDEQGTIRQVVQAKTGGLIVKQPGAIAVGVEIAA